MAARSVNKVILVGNLTRDPELRYTPQGTAVVSFGVATNREWTVDGVKKEAADFHNVVAWNKLAEICDQLLNKGDKTYVEGRLQTRDWTDSDGNKRYKTEVVINEMIVLYSKSGSDSSYSNDSYEAESETDTEDSMDDVDEIDLDKVLSEDFGVDEDEEVEESEEEEKEGKKSSKKKK